MRIFFKKNLTEAELVLWEKLKNKKLDERKFRRQYRVGHYIVDFYCRSERLVIELDRQHPFEPEGIVRNKERDNYLKMMNVTVIHFENKEVLNNLTHVLNEIKAQFVNYEL